MDIETDFIHPPFVFVLYEIYQKGILEEQRGSREFCGGGVSFLFQSIHILSNDVPIIVVFYDI